MSVKIGTVAFDADDTLWHNERFFQLTQQRFAEILADYSDPEDLDVRLLAAERRNLGHYGYGIKGFMLSMIETAIEVTDQTVPGHVIQKILDVGQDMLRHPVELLPHAQQAVEAMADRGPVLLITKGDLLDQERKLAQSGLGDLFTSVEILSEKTGPVYGAIFSRYAGGAETSVMVGNSMKSDILPVLDAGAWACHVPHDLAWELEHAEPPEGHSKFVPLENLGEFIDWIEAAH